MSMSLAQLGEIAKVYDPRDDRRLGGKVATAGAGLTWAGWGVTQRAHARLTPAESFQNATMPKDEFTERMRTRAGRKTIHGATASRQGEHMGRAGLGLVALGGALGVRNAALKRRKRAVQES